MGDVRNLIERAEPGGRAIVPSEAYRAFFFGSAGRRGCRAICSRVNLRNFKRRGRACAREFLNLLQSARYGVLGADRARDVANEATFSRIVAGGVATRENAAVEARDVGRSAASQTAEGARPTAPR